MIINMFGPSVQVQASGWPYIYQSTKNSSTRMYLPLIPTHYAMLDSYFSLALWRGILLNKTSYKFSTLVIVTAYSKHNPCPCPCPCPCPTLSRPPGRIDCWGYSARLVRRVRNQQSALCAVQKPTIEGTNLKAGQKDKKRGKGRIWNIWINLPRATVMPMRWKR
ncbi:hypothetical protein BDW72DRAFT_166161 [Aspergillus terricola var. indicus]